MNDLLEEFGRRWNRFWFTPADPLPCCLLRIAVGLATVLHFLDLSSGLARWYARDGVLSPAAVDRLHDLATGGDANYHFSYLRAFPAGAELTAVHGLAIAVAVAFAAGLFTRIAGILTLVAVLAYVHRTPQVSGHVEPLLSFLIAYLCIAPSGARLSLDRLLADRWSTKKPDTLTPGPDKWSVAANLGLRLIQVHVAMFYAMMGLTKLYGDAWWDGAAVWMLLAQTESRPLDLTGLRKLGQLGEYAINFWTQGIVYYELAFPALIWNRFTRPVLLALAPLVWLSIALATGLALFSFTMCVASMAFLACGASDTNPKRS